MTYSVEVSGSQLCVPTLLDRSGRGVHNWLPLADRTHHEATSIAEQQIGEVTLYQDQDTHRLAVIRMADVLLYHEKQVRQAATILKLSQIASRETSCC